MIKPVISFIGENRSLAVIPHCEFVDSIRASSGQYIMVVNNDDQYESDAITKLMECVSETKAEVILFNLESHWESTSDVRAITPFNYAFPFNAIPQDGFPEIDTRLLFNSNPYVGACFVKRSFLIRNGLWEIDEAFVKKIIMNKPKLFTLRDYLGHHLIRTYEGPRTPQEATALSLERLLLCQKYADGDFFLRRWRKPIRNVINNVSLNTDLGQMANLLPRDYISQCSIHLVDHCNLNCKSCSHFSCLAKKEDFKLETKDFERDARRLARVTKRKIRILELYGGEPLLHPDVPAIMKIARKYFPRSTIRLITNGILLNQQSEQFWESCRRNRILIAPTKYPISIDWKSVEEKAQKYKVDLDFFGGTGHCEKTLYHKPLDVNGLQNPVLSYTNCQHVHCVNLYKGKLYHCPIVAYIHYFNRQFNKNMKVSSADYIDIHDDTMTARKIFDFCSRPVPFCRNCLSRRTTRGHPWETTKKDIKEWTL